MIHVEDHAAHCRMAREKIIRSLLARREGGLWRPLLATYHERKGARRRPRPTPSKTKARPTPPTKAPFILASAITGFTIMGKKCSKYYACSGSFPLYVPSSLSRIRFSISTARRLSSQNALSFSRFPLKIYLYTRKCPNEYAMQ